MMYSNTDTHHKSREGSVQHKLKSDIYSGTNIGCYGCLKKEIEIYTKISEVNLILSSISNKLDDFSKNKFQETEILKKIQENLSTSEEKNYEDRMQEKYNYFLEQINSHASTTWSLYEIVFTIFSVILAAYAAISCKTIIDLKKEYSSLLEQYKFAGNNNVTKIMETAKQELESSKKEEFNENNREDDIKETINTNKDDAMKKLLFEKLQKRIEISKLRKKYNKDKEFLIDELNRIKNIDYTSMNLTERLNIVLKTKSIEDQINSLDKHFTEEYSKLNLDLAEIDKKMTKK